MFELLMYYSESLGNFVSLVKGTQFLHILTATCVNILVKED